MDTSTNTVTDTVTSPRESCGQHNSPHIQVKIVIAGGFGAGKTTMVATVSETEPLSIDETLTEAGEPVDSLAGVAAKTTTTVGMDYGRRTLAEPAPLTLSLYGTPGQPRFWFLWDELSFGAIGAVVLADTRRLADSFHSIDYFETRGTPFVVAVNQFDGGRRYPEHEVRQALDLPEGVPIVTCDARDFGSAVAVLEALLVHALAVHAASTA